MATSYMPEPESASKLPADVVAEALDADVLLLNGPLERHNDRKLIQMCCSRRRRTNVLFMGVTGGGDPNAAFRMARILQENYTRFSFFVSGYCKSAGTLLALGAHEIIVSAHGELGPLDVQMEKEDDLWGYQSGLTVMTALTALHEKALATYEHFFLETEVKSNGRISLRTASRIASDLTGSLFAPIYQQIDPMHIGEAYRSMAIARHYGQRLMEKSRNFDEAALDELISGYPSHGFVIDKLEAKKLFREVREPSSAEDNLQRSLKRLALTPVSESPYLQFLSMELKELKKDDTDETPTTAG